MMVLMEPKLFVFVLREKVHDVDAVHGGAIDPDE